MTLNKRVVYLPEYAKWQLTMTDDPSVRERPIPCREEPDPEFPLKTSLDGRTNDVGTIVCQGAFFPDRVQDLDTIVGRMKDTRKAAGEGKSGPATQAAPSSPLYRVFHGQGDDECWAAYDGSGIRVLLQHNFFTATADYYFQRQEKVLDSILKAGAGIVMNRKEVVFPPTYTYFTPRLPIFSCDDALPSRDGSAYILFARHEMGRGWGVLLRRTAKRNFVISEDHTDNIRDYLLGGVNGTGFIEDHALPIDFKHLRRYNARVDVPEFKPTVDDFVKAYHIDEKGKRAKA